MNRSGINRKKDVVSSLGKAVWLVTKTWLYSECFVFSGGKNKNDQGFCGMCLVSLEMILGFKYVLQISLLIVRGTLSRHHWTRSANWILRRHEICVLSIFLERYDKFSLWTFKEFIIFTSFEIPLWLLDFFVAVKTFRQGTSVVYIFSESSLKICVIPYLIVV